MYLFGTLKIVFMKYDLATSSLVKLKSELHKKNTKKFIEADSIFFMLKKDAENHLILYQNQIR